MRFSRKSPAVGSMNRHSPEDDLMATEEKARVAVSSRGLASAAAEGSRTTPARETEMTDADAVVVAARLVGGDVIGAVVVCATTAAEVEIMFEDDDAGTVEMEEATSVAALEGAEAVVGISVSSSPKLKDWLGSAALQAAWSMSFPATVKQVPGAFSGVNAWSPAVPLNGKS